MRPDDQSGGRAVDGFWTYRALDISSIHGTEPNVGSQTKAIVYIMDFLSEENAGDWIPVLHKALYSLRTLRFFCFFFPQLESHHKCQDNFYESKEKKYL